MNKLFLIALIATLFVAFAMGACVEVDCDGFKCFGEGDDSYCLKQCERHEDCIENFSCDENFQCTEGCTNESCNGFICDGEGPSSKCRTKCSQNADCIQGYSCIDNQCIEGCDDNTCEGFLCNKDAGENGICRTNCEDNSQCTDGYSCNESFQCVQGCSDNACEGFICNEEKTACLDRCANDDECYDGYVCTTVDRRCVVDTCDETKCNGFRCEENGLWCREICNPGFEEEECVDGRICEDQKCIVPRQTVVEVKITLPSTLKWLSADERTKLVDIVVNQCNKNALTSYQTFDSHFVIVLDADVSCTLEEASWSAAVSAAGFGTVDLPQSTVVKDYSQTCFASGASICHSKDPLCPVCALGDDCNVDEDCASEKCIDKVCSSSVYQLSMAVAFIAVIIAIIF